MLRLAALASGTDGLASTTGGLGVLTTHAQVPVVTETAVHADALHALEIFAELDIDLLADVLVGLAILVVALSVEEPGRDVELLGVGDD